MISIKVYITLSCIFVLCSLNYVYAKEPFVRSGGHILMKGGNQEKESLFVFDTGSSVTIVSEEFCKTANCKKNLIWIYIIDYKGKWKMHQMVRISDFYIDNLHFKNVKAFLKKDFEHSFSGYVCEEFPVEGILGYNLLKQHNWKLNFTDTTYSTQQTPIHLENGQILDFRLCGKIPYISLQINDKPVKNILFDTGDSRNVVLSSNIFNQLFTENVYTRQFLANSLNSATEKQYTNQLYKGDISVLSDSYPLVVGSTANKQGNALGGGFLANSTVAINYGDKTIHIDKTRHTRIWNKIVGISFALEGNDIIITSIFADLKEKYPELQLGKVLKSVNEKNSCDLAEMNPCERRMFLRMLNHENLEIVMETGTVYNLSPVF